MGIPGENNVLEAPCRRDQRLLKLGNRLLEELDLAPAPELYVSCDLIVSGAPGMELLAKVPDLPDEGRLYE